MKILGIGNAIVDVICKVDDKYLLDNKLTKSTMKLVDEVEFKKLLSTLKIENTISGGSVANSIVGLSQLKNDVGFIAQEIKAVLDNHSEVKAGQGIWKQAADAKSNRQSVSHTAMIPMLVKALQEADDKIDALTARVTTLEG